MGKWRYRHDRNFVRALDERTMRYNGARRVKRYRGGRQGLCYSAKVQTVPPIRRDPKVLEQWFLDGYHEALEHMEALRIFLEEDGGYGLPLYQWGD